jgi:hypothetical protein
MAREGIVYDSNDPWRRLMIAIIERGLKDYRCPMVANVTSKYHREAAKRSVRAHAEHFLLSEDCRYMCEVIGISHEMIVKHYKGSGK